MRAEALLGQIPRDFGQRLGVDDARPQFGQISLRALGMSVEQFVGDGQPEDSVAKKLQTLVGG
jgi:hypothetical protein